MYRSLLACPLSCLSLAACDQCKRAASSSTTKACLSKLKAGYHSFVLLSLLLQFSLHSNVFAVSQRAHSLLFNILDRFIYAGC